MSIRENTQEFEKKHLSSNAVLAENTKGMLLP